MGYTIKGNTGGASKAFADKMLLFSAYGDFDQQYDPRFLLFESVAARFFAC